MGGPGRKCVFCGVSEVSDEHVLPKWLQKHLPPGPLAYVRLRGQQYSEEARGAWLELLQAEGRTRDVFAFAKHKDVPADDPFTGVALACTWEPSALVNGR